jgi:hypothetical protein
MLNDQIRKESEKKYFGCLYYQLLDKEDWDEQHGKLVSNAVQSCGVRKMLFQA